METLSDSYSHSDKDYSDYDGKDAKSHHTLSEKRTNIFEHQGNPWIFEDGFDWPTFSTRKASKCRQL